MFTTSLDDIVFEGRNQSYGAYQLRRDYQRNVTQAGGITLGLCGLLLVAWLTWPAAPAKVVVANPVIAQPIEVTILPAIKVEEPKLAKQARPRLPQQTTAPAPVAPAIATRVAPDGQVTPPTEQPAEVAPIEGAVGHAAPGAADELATGFNIKDGSGNEAATSTTSATNEAFTYVEKMPEFAGGQAALLRYLRDHLRYPSQALRQQMEGRVFLSFVVRADGSIAEATVLKGLGYGLDEEALRVVRQMPAWTPGYQAQHAVAVRFTLPITFKIQ